MKRIKYLVFSVLLAVIGMTQVNALEPSYSTSVSSSTIENGNKVTYSVTVKNTAAWNIKVVSAGNTNGCSNSWTDVTNNGKNTTKTFSVTCTASSVGVISFTVSGDIAEEGGTVKNLSGTKTVKVNAKTPDSVINTLKSLSVKGYDLNQTFDKETLEYTVSVPTTTTQVTIEAERTDSKSSITGTGDFEVAEGSNHFEVICTSQSGSSRTYVITVNVEDSNPITIEVNGTNYTLLKTSRSITIPSLFTESSTTIEEQQIPIFTNDVNGLTLIAAKNDLGEVKFFIYKDNTYIPYIELTGDSTLIYPLDKEIDLPGFTKTTCTIDNEEVTCYQYKGLNAYLVKGMNLENGQEYTYMYDKDSGVFQVFNEELWNQLQKESNLFLYCLIGSGVLVLVCIMIIISLLKSRGKVKKYILALENKMSHQEEQPVKKSKKKKEVKEEPPVVEEPPKEEEKTLEDTKELKEPENLEELLDNLEKSNHEKESNK